ncbi:MAG TPA: GvpL/GvpF family gas vesicle protein, partial [Myxococcaceae bacterium]
MTAEGGWVWMYGVAGGDLEALSDGAAGVGGAPPRAISAAGLTAIVGDVGDPEYGETALRRNLEDLDWLGRTARAHHAVLEAVAERGPVVPMRLATLFASDAGVTATLQERADDFRGALSLISARSEWSVKA